VSKTTTSKITSSTSFKIFSMLERAEALITEAIDTHIYDAQSGETPPKNCAYSKWLKDLQAFKTKLLASKKGEHE